MAESNINNGAFEGDQTASSTWEAFNEAKQDFNYLESTKATVEQATAAANGVVWKATLAEVNAIDPLVADRAYGVYDDGANNGYYYWDGTSATVDYNRPLGLEKSEGNLNPSDNEKGVTGSQVADFSVSKNDLFNDINLSNPANFTNARVNPTGTTTNSTNWLSTSIDIAGLSDITISGFDGISDSSARYVVLDIDNNVVTSELSEGATVNTPVTFTNTTGVTLLVNIENAVGIDPIDNDYINTFQVEKGLQATSFVPFGNGKIKNDFIDVSAVYNDVYIENISTTAMFIYLPLKGNQFARLQFIRTTTPPQFEDIWRMNAMYLATIDNEGAFTLGSQIVLSGIWENALQTPSSEGYIEGFLGSSHGYEEFSNITFIADGKFYDSIETIPDGFHQDLRIVQRAVFKNSDGTLDVGVSNRSWFFSKNEILLDQTFNWSATIPFNSRTFTAMCSIARKTESDTIQTTSFASRNDNWLKYDVSEDGFSTAIRDEANDGTRVIIGGEEITLDMEVLDFYPKLPDAGIWVQNSAQYNKVYFNMGATTVNSGDVWGTKCLYKFSV